MSERAAIECEILDEESMLEQTARLLESGASLAEWPEPVRSALALALEDPSMPLAETWKAVALRRHLFGPAGAVPAHIAAPEAPSLSIASAPSGCDRASPRSSGTALLPICCEPLDERLYAHAERSRDRDHAGFDDAFVHGQQREPVTTGRGGDDLVDRIGVEAHAEPRALDGDPRCQGQDGDERARLELLEAIIQALG